MTYSNPYSIPSTTTNFIPFSGMGMRKNGRAMLLPSNYQGDGSTLSLDFTTMGGVLDPRLTFTRASSATFVNSSGYVEYAGANLLLQSETISTSPWVDQNGATRLQVSITNPIGGATATQVTSGGPSNAISQGPTYQAGLPHVIRIWVRAGTSSQLQLGVFAGGFVTGTISVISGTATVSDTGLFLVTGLTATWTQLQIVYPSLTGSGAFLIYPDTASPVAGRTIYVWGAQLNPGSTAQTYYPTTTAAYHAPRFDYSPTNIGEPRGLLVEGNVTNFITQSQALSGYAAYNMMAISIDGTVTDPMGGNEAKKIAASTSATSVFHGFLRNATNAGTATTVTVSIFAKRNNYKYLFLFDGSSATASTRFNLDTGVTDQNLGSGYVSSKATPYSNGWYRCEMTANVPANINRSWGFQAVADTATYASTGASYTGTGNINDGIYVIGWQVEAGSGASSYIPTGASQVTRNADKMSMADISTMQWNQTAGTFSLHMNVSAETNTSSFPTFMGMYTATPVRVVRFLLNNSSGTTPRMGNDTWTATPSQIVSNIITRPFAPNAFKYAVSLSNTGQTLNQVVNAGSVVTTSGTGTMQTPTRLLWNQDPSALDTEYFPIHMRSLKYWPTALSNAQLQSITT